MEMIQRAFRTSLNRRRRQYPPRGNLPGTLHMRQQAKPAPNISTRLNELATPREKRVPIVTPPVHGAFLRAPLLGRPTASFDWHTAGI